MKPTRGFRKNYKNKLQKHNLWDLANKIGLSALAKCSLRGGCARAASALVAAGRPPRSVHVHPLAPTPLKPLEAMSHLLKVFVCLFVFSSVVCFFLCLSVFSSCLQMCFSMVKPDLWSKWEKKINFFLKNFFFIQIYICMGKAGVSWQGANAKASFGHPLWARNETPSPGRGVAPRRRGSLLVLPFGGKHLNSSDRKLLFGLSVD